MKILVVEDDRDTREGLQMLLQEFGLDVRAASTLAEARAQLAAFDPDVCLTDLQLPDGDGLDFIRTARAEDSLREIVVLTGHGSLDSAVEAMKAGAFDYLVKPLRPVQLEAVLGRLRGGAPGGDGDAALWKTLDETGRFGTMVGVSSAMREMCAVIARIARSDAPVMITGESGSGKEAAAQTIHDLSRRRGKPLVAINCGAVSANLIESELFGHEKGAFTGADRRRAGYFELAQGGTLFLDEVTEMPPDLQVKFLRVLETRSFRRVGGNEELSSDVRVISSSNRDLVEAVQKKTLREDLYYRLNVLPLHIVPLRERREDIAVLARHFLARVAESEEGGRRSFSPAALEKLAAHAWPGNVRELRNAVHRAYVLSDGETVDDATLAAVLSGRPSGVFPKVRPPAPGAAAREKEATESRPADARAARRTRRGRPAERPRPRRRLPRRGRAAPPRAHAGGGRRQQAEGGRDAARQPEDRLQQDQAVRARALTPGAAPAQAPSQLARDAEELGRLEGLPAGSRRRSGAAARSRASRCPTSREWAGRRTRGSPRPGARTPTRSSAASRGPRSRGAASVPPGGARGPRPRPRPRRRSGPRRRAAGGARRGARGRRRRRGRRAAVSRSGGSAGAAPRGPRDGRRSDRSRGRVAEHAADAVDRAVVHEGNAVSGARAFRRRRADRGRRFSRRGSRSGSPSACGRSGETPSSRATTPGCAARGAGPPPSRRSPSRLSVAGAVEPARRARVPRPARLAEVRRVRRDVAGHDVRLASVSPDAGRRSACG